MRATMDWHAAGDRHRAQAATRQQASTISTRTASRGNRVLQNSTMVHACPYAMCIASCLPASNHRCLPVPLGSSAAIHVK